MPECVDPLTPEAAHASAFELSAWCPRCREGRIVDLLALIVARPNRPLRSMRFRCEGCGSSAGVTMILDKKPGHAGHGGAGAVGAGWLRPTPSPSCQTVAAS